MQSFPDELPGASSAPRIIAAEGRPPLLAAHSTLADAALSALRIASAMLLMQHGVQKLFGLLLPPDRPFAGAPELFSRTWFAGMLETFGGLLLLVGLFTRPVAFVLSGLMAFAYFIAHAGESFWPILNGGELAALFCFVFLALAGIGGGRFSLDQLIARRENRAGVSTPSPEPVYPIDRRKRRRRNRSRA